MKIVKAFTRGIVSVWNAAIDFSYFVTDGFIWIAKKIIHGFVSLFKAIFSFPVFVLTSLGSLIKKTAIAIVAFPRFVVISIFKIVKKVLYVVLFPFKFVVMSLIKIVKKVTHPAPNSLYRILLNYLSFIVACWVVLLAFITTQTYLQLAGAIFLFPLIVYLIFKIFPRKARRYAKSSATAVGQPEKSVEKAEKAEKAEIVERESRGISISDIDKRVFLKLIGGAGITLFLFSIFNKRAEGTLFKSLPASGVSGAVTLQDTSGNKINPANSQPTDGYKISEVDDNIISFFGYTNKDGAWFVMRGDTDMGSFRYNRGDSNFPGNWKNRENLSYDYYNNVFRS